MNFSLAIAQTVLQGFNKHYRLFRETSNHAKQRFETSDWHGQQQAQRERIAFYDTRVYETATVLETQYNASNQDLSSWAAAKLDYVGLLTQHLQPELAETFFNSVSCKILHRDYFVNNDFLFVRPAASTEYLENDEPSSQSTFCAYYPAITPSYQNVTTLMETMVIQMIRHFDLNLPIILMNETAQKISDIFLKGLQTYSDTSEVQWRDNLQIQVHRTLFYRNKAAYAVGRLLNGDTSLAFALPILHAKEKNIIFNNNDNNDNNDNKLIFDQQYGLIIDAALIGESALLKIFSFARAYFMVDMAIPSATVQFLRYVMPSKPRAELYNALGLHKHGKTVFYRDVLYHLRHSYDKFRIAPGIKGMVMLVFDLPSFPYVFKLIKDFYPPAKDTTREKIQSKYQLVKQHDRVGRMADTLEYSNVAFPKHRFTDELIAEIRHFCPSLLEESVLDELYILKHLYIERRMIPLNLYLQTATPEQQESAIIEYGQAIKDLVAANIFPGDMLWKNFGVTRHDKVVFYDYDEIEYLSDCNFRRIPIAHTEEQELASEPWYPIAINDVFPETFSTFLLGNRDIRRVFMKYHADLLEPEFWKQHQDLIKQGCVPSIYPYERNERFVY